MIELMKVHNNKELNRLESVISFLSKDFFNVYDSLPRHFCHGDFHPLNIIWSEDSIKSVIDWEFVGLKLEIYDIANMLGCIGIEEPIGLVQGFANTFINEIKKRNFISDISLNYLLDCIIAIRFGWLSEWFRKKDPDMISLEIKYMNLLLKNKELFKKSWNII
jgi:homoserine kinase type II